MSDPAISGPAARVLLVGAGQVAADQHLPALEALGPRAELVGVHDPDTARASALVDGRMPAWGDLDEALRVLAPDVVLVAAPPAVHVDVVPRCLRAGAWVVCEKPPARSLAELDVIAAAEVETGLPCCFVFQQRFGSAARLLADPATQAVLGPVRAAAAQTTWFRDAAYYDVPWRGHWSGEGGGVLSSLGVHALDLVLSVAGGWTEAVALGARLARDIAVDNVTGAVVRLEAGGLLTVLSSALSPRQESRVRLDYDDATVELVHLYTYTNADWTLTVRPGAAPEVRAALEHLWAAVAPDPVTQHAAMIGAVLDARATGGVPPCSGPAGRASFELVTACYAAALTGRAVRREELTPESPFYHRLDGHLEPWSPTATPARRS